MLFTSQTGVSQASRMHQVSQAQDQVRPQRQAPIVNTAAA